MLSLVAYGNSDSEDENSSTNDEEGIENQDIDSNVGSVQIITAKADSNSTDNIFVSLPKPQSNDIENVIEEEDEFLKKKEVPTEKPKKQAVKITVPSLSQFDSDDEDVPAKKPKIDTKACGLFAILPPPKTVQVTTKHFVPNAVKRNMNKSVKPPRPVMPARTNIKEKNAVEDQDSDEEDIGNLPDTFDDEIWQKVCGRKEKRTPKPVIAKNPENTPVIQLDPEVTKPYDGLDNQAFKELIGANSKRKGDVIDIVDINEDEILSDKNIWMTKSLTDPEMAPKHVVKDPVNDTCKRKHHITYLAQQAKANEQELQNQWAASRFTRQKTQAKYGF